MRQILFIMLGLSTVLFASFSKEGNIVTHSTTGLQWQDNVIGSSMEWASAITHCEDLELDGQSDWRLPNLKELTSIVDDTKTNPSINTAIFEHTASSYYWSSTTYVGNSDYAWSVYFSYGYQYYRNKSNSNYVRCVRAGQFDPLPLAKVLFVSEVPKDDTLQLDAFTKEWTFGTDLSGYSVEVVSSDFSSYSSVSIDGTHISMELTPDVTKPINVITLKLKDASGQHVSISGSEIFWARNRTNHAPRLADGQSSQMSGDASTPVTLDIETYDADGDTVSLSVVDDDGGNVFFDSDNPQRLYASFSSDDTVLHTVTIELSDGKETREQNIKVLRFNASNIESYYSDVETHTATHHFNDVAFVTLAGIFAGQEDPSDATKRIFRPTDDASMAEVLAVVLKAGVKAKKMTMTSSGSYLSTYPRWASPYYTHAREAGAVSDLGGDLSIHFPSREEVAQIVVKVLSLEEKLEVFSNIGAEFDDKDSFSYDAMHHYGQVVKLFGLFMTNATANPSEKVSRAELASIARHILMMPSATVVSTPAVVESGETFSITLENLSAIDLSLDYEFVEKNASRAFAVDRRVYDPLNIDSSLVRIGDNKIIALLENSGVREVLFGTVTVKMPYEDMDGDGISDSADLDIDGDGVDNLEDAFAFDSSESIDTDNDGTGNNADLDDDGDGMSDEDEIAAGRDPLDSSDAVNITRV